MTPAYTRTTVALHWIVAALVITAIALGWVMTELTFSPLKLRLFNWHKWIGVTVLALIIVRSLWRLWHLWRPRCQSRSPDAAAAWVHLVAAYTLKMTVTSGFQRGAAHQS
jgi:cytochrome b561